MPINNKPTTSMQDLMKQLEQVNLNTTILDPKRELIDAVINNQPTKIASVLADKKSRLVDIVDSTGTPLIVLAAHLGHIEAFDELMKNSPILNLKSPEYGNALQAAAYNAKNDQATPRCSGYQKENCHIIATKLIQRNIGITEEKQKGEPIDLNIKSNPTQKSPLHYAAQSGNKALAELLIQAGADATQGDKDNKRPSHFAEQYGYPKLAAYFRCATLKQDAKNAVSFAVDKENGEIQVYLKNWEFIDSNNVLGWDAILNQLKATSIENEKLCAADDSTRCSGKLRIQVADTAIPAHQDCVIQEFIGEDGNRSLSTSAILHIVIKEKYRDDNLVHATLQHALQTELNLTQIPMPELSNAEKIAKKNATAIQTLLKQYSQKPSTNNFRIKTRNELINDIAAPQFNTGEVEAFKVDLSKIPMPGQDSGTLESWLVGYCGLNNIKINRSAESKLLANAHVVIPALPGEYSSDDSLDNNALSRAEFVGEWTNPEYSQQRYITLAITTHPVVNGKPLAGKNFVLYKGNQNNVIQGKLPSQTQNEYTNFEAIEITNDVALRMAETNPELYKKLQLNGTIFIAAKVNFTQKVYSTGTDALYASLFYDQTRGGESSYRTKGGSSIPDTMGATRGGNTRGGTPSAYSMVSSGSAENTNRHNVTEDGTYELDLNGINFFLVQPTVINVNHAGLEKDFHLGRFLDAAVLLMHQKFNDTAEYLKQTFGVVTPKTYADLIKKLDLIGKPYNYTTKDTDFVEETVLKIAGIIQKPTYCKFHPYGKAVEMYLGIPYHQVTQLLEFYNKKYPNSLQCTTDPERMYGPYQSFIFNLDIFYENIAEDIRQHLVMEKEIKPESGNSASAYTNITQSVDVNNNNAPVHFGATVVKNNDTSDTAPKMNH